MCEVNYLSLSQSRSIVLQQSYSSAIPGKYVSDKMCSTLSKYMLPNTCSRNHFS